MAREFLLPDIGEGLTEADIVRWLVDEGDTVEADQPIVEVETDKAVVEIPSPYAGTVLRHGAGEGETLAVGAVLVVIGEQGEARTDSARASPARPEPEPAAPDRDETVSVEGRQQPDHGAPIVGSLSEDAEVLGDSPESSSRPAPIKALPLVRKMAREMDVDLSEVVGTGPGGRIVREDIEALASSSSSAAPKAAAAARPSAPAMASPSASRRPGEDRRVPMTRLRRTIAANMSKSWAEVPHVTTFDDVDATRLLEVRSALGARHDAKIPMEALAVKAVLPALEAHPEFNATVDGDDLILHGRHDIGFAVDTPEGLMVAVVKDAGSMSVLDLAGEIRRLGEGARDRTLAPDELAGQTFTITNIGAVGGGHGTPIVPPGTTAILSLGRARQKPVVFGDELMIAPVMPLSLSYDHRVIDGAMGRRFMALVLENLEEPALFLAG